MRLHTIPTSTTPGCTNGHLGSWSSSTGQFDQRPGGDRRPANNNGIIMGQRSALLNHSALLSVGLNGLWNLLLESLSLTLTE